jgi:hypothetical protein
VRQDQTKEKTNAEADERRCHWALFDLSPQESPAAVQLLHSGVDIRGRLAAEGLQTILQHPFGGLRGRAYGVQRGAERLIESLFASIDNVADAMADPSGLINRLVHLLSHHVSSNSPPPAVRLTNAGP